ncbi:MAG: cell division protein ZapA [Lachnospiraceae bacterium]|nr:cell division protein ZapA [Lachnospiraceae bacterium]
MNGNEQRVYIDGRPYVISGSASGEYLHKVADYIDGKIQEVSQQSYYSKLDPEMKSVLMYINLADDYYKTKQLLVESEDSKKKLQDDFFKLKGTIADKDKEIARLNDERSTVEKAHSNELAAVRESDNRQLESVKSSYQLQLEKMKNAETQQIASLKAENDKINALLKSKEAEISALNEKLASVQSGKMVSIENHTSQNKNKNNGKNK